MLWGFTVFQIWSNVITELALSRKASLCHFYDFEQPYIHLFCFFLIVWLQCQYFNSKFSVLQLIYFSSISYTDKSHGVFSMSPDSKGFFFYIYSLEINNLINLKIASQNFLWPRKKMYTEPSKRPHHSYVFA